MFTFSIDLPLPPLFGLLLNYLVFYSVSDIVGTRYSVGILSLLEYIIQEAVMVGRLPNNVLCVTMEGKYVSIVGTDENYAFVSGGS